MKLVCGKEQLYKAISSTEKASNKQLPLAVLSSLLFVAEKNYLTIKSTNLDIGIEYSFPTKVEKSGTVAVPTQVISQFVSNIRSNSDLKIELIGNQLHISNDRQSTLIKINPHEDFPIIPRIQTEDIIGSISINGGDFAAASRAVSFAAAQTDIKPEIATVYFAEDGKNATFVATDMFRLAEKKIVFGKGGEEEHHILIPAKNVGEIARVIEKEEEVDLIYSKSEISFSTDKLYLFSRLVTGEYLNYTQALPTKTNTKVLVSKEDLISTIKSTAVFADKMNTISFKIIPSDNLFEITSSNQDTGESMMSLEARIEGEPLDLKFNGRFILDSFQSINGDTIALNFSGPGKPLSIESSTDHSFRYVIAPLNQ